MKTLELYLADHSWGRRALHLLCVLRRPGNLRWHAAGFIRG